MTARPGAGGIDVADIYLGPTGAEILLPPIRRIGSFDARIPVDYSKQIDKATMLDGQTRANFRSHHPRRWGPIEWEAITAAERANFIALRNRNERLRFQNGFEGATWYCVIIADMRIDVDVKHSCTGDTRFSVSMTLEEMP
jgi:hypothetical protein